MTPSLIDDRETNRHTKQEEKNKMSPAPEFISKPLGFRMQELIRSLLVVRDCANAANNGMPHLVLPVFGQLRALLTEKARNNPPLLVSLASVLGKELTLYAFPGTDADLFPEMGSEPVLRIGGLPVSAHRTNPHQERLSLEAFLDQKMVFAGGTHYSRRQLLKLLAENAGGAHFSARVPADLIGMSAVEIDGLPAIHRAVLQVAQAIIESAAALLRELCDFSVHFYLLVPPDPVPNTGVILDARYPGTSMQLTLSVGDWGRLQLGAVGIDGFRAQLAPERLVDWSKPRHVAVTHHITDNLDSGLSILVDGEPYAEAQVSHPLFLTQDLTAYKRFYNRSAENADAGLSFAMLTHLALAGMLSLQQRCALMKYFEDRYSDADASCLLFRKGAYAETPPGEQEMRMTGSVKKWDWRRLLAGEWPSEAS